ncbi:MAG: hypothetical protein JWO31_3385 [Phycisphaerales bacterium]|nr:hypothetical protein [Phycisphaerales bacterium]
MNRNHRTIDRQVPSTSRAAARLFAAALAVVAGGVTGCGATGGKGRNTQPVTRAAPVDPPLPTGQDVLDRASDARRQALQFELLAGRLREADPARQRPIVRDVFVALGDLLPMLAGPQRTGVFAHQFGIVTGVRDQLSNRPERLNDDGLLDDGLGATYNALRDLSYNAFYADPELSPRLEALAGNVSRLRTLRGTDHAYTVADAVSQISAVLTKMTGTFHERVTASPEAATQPGSPAGPPTATPGPATAPASEPAK